MHTFSCVAFSIVATLFAIKLLWNATVVYWLAWRTYTAGTSREGTSFNPQVEVVLLVLGCFVTAFSEYGPMASLYVAGSGLALIIASYLLFALGAVISGVFLRYIVGYRPPSNDEDRKR